MIDSMHVPQYVPLMIPQSIQSPTVLLLPEQAIWRRLSFLVALQISCLYTCPLWFVPKHSPRYNLNLFSLIQVLVSQDPGYRAPLSQVRTMFLP